MRATSEQANYMHVLFMKCNEHEKNEHEKNFPHMIFGTFVLSVVSC